MPTIPQYERGARLSTQPASVTRDEGFAGTEGRSMQQMGQVLGEVAQRWQKTVDTAQLNSFEAKKEVNLAEIKSRASQDQDPSNADKYIKELNQYKRNALKGLNPRVKEQARMELEKDTALASIKIQNNFRKKYIDSGKKNLNIASEQLQQDIAEEQNKKVKQEKIMKLQNMIKGNVGSIISEGRANEMLDDAEEGIREKQFYHDLYNKDPEDVKKNIKEGIYGKDAETKMGREDELQSHIKNQDKVSKWQDKQSKIKGTVLLGKQLMNGTLTTQKINKLFKEGQLDEEGDMIKVDSLTAAVFRKIVKDGTFMSKETLEKTDTSKPEFFINLLDEALEGEDNEMFVIREASKSYGRSEMGVNQFSFFLEAANEKFQARRERVKREKSPFWRAYNELKIWSDSITFTEKMFPAAMLKKMAMDLISRTQKGENPEEAVKEIKADLSREITQEEEPDESNTMDKWWRR
jgi:hypothetical protein